MATGTAPRSCGADRAGRAVRVSRTARPTVNIYAMCAMRHMHEYGTTSEQLAWIKVAASHHAQHNPHAHAARRGHGRGGGQLADDRRPAAPAGLLRRHRRRRRADRRHGPEIAKQPEAAAGEGASAPARRRSTRWAARSTSPTPARVWSGPPAFAEAGVKPADIKYASIYDSFTITVLMQLEDLGFCEKGAGRQVRRRRQPDLGRRQAAVQHRRRRALQQPPGQPRRHDQGDRGGAPAARRGASRRCR